MPRVVHFEVYADNTDRAIMFYKNVFGWKFQRWDGPMEYWLVKTGEKNEAGIDGGLLKREKQVQGDSITAFPCTIDVPSVDVYVKKIKENGGVITQPKSAIPGVGWFANCKNTENNVFGILQNDMNAK